MIQKSLRSLKEHIHQDPLKFSEDLHKTRRFYEFILVDTKSVEITRTSNFENPSKIAYSKLKTFKFMNPTYWNQDPYTE